MKDLTCRSEEHTSELQSHSDIVCRLLLEKKKSLQCNIKKSINTYSQRTINNYSIKLIQLNNIGFVFLIVFKTFRHGASYFFFFFNDTATTEIYTLSLHDALPIYSCAGASELLGKQSATASDVHH